MARTSWLLIDGYNLLHASGVFGSGGRTSLESSREALLDWLAQVLDPAEQRRTTIVFDASDAPPGLPRREQRQGLTIRFAPRDREADEVIEKLIQEHSSPKTLVVVSSDHRLHRAARRRRATPIDSEQWVATMRRAHPAPRPRPRGPESDKDAELTEDELQAWLKEFGESND